MGWAFWAVVCLLVVMTVLVVCLLLLVTGERKRARAERQALLAEQERLDARLEELSRAAATQKQLEEDRADWVITQLGDETLSEAVEARPVSDQLVLSAAFGEPVVKVLAFGHGVRRALSAENRNRIRFEIRREVRRTRRTRRREMKEAWRQMRTDRRHDQPETVPDAPGSAGSSAASRADGQVAAQYGSALPQQERSA